MNRPMTVEATIDNLPAKVAKMVAIEILLAEPETLDDDTLESGLYILREEAARHMNNTEKLDGIKRTMRRIETQLGIIQRINVLCEEYGATSVAGR